MLRVAVVSVLQFEPPPLLTGCAAAACNPAVQQRTRLGAYLPLALLAVPVALLSSTMHLQ